MAHASSSKKNVLPHRGQVVVVKPIPAAPAFVLDEPLTYIVPRENDCVLGGINEESDSTIADSTQTSQIVDRCVEMAPLAERPEIITHRAGIRPARKIGVRLEAERLRDGRFVIHNYGHGGCGISLSWGCTQKVLELIRCLPR